MTEDIRAQVQESLGESYTIDSEIGGGGMSRVFAATDTSLGRTVVIKVLAPELAAAVNVERFRREIQVAARLQHSYIVPLLSAGIAGDLPYYTMPLVEGESLRSLLTRSGALPIADTIRILRDTAEALSYAHEHGIVHRDIKPENILISGSHAHIADFGVAKALSDATTTGDGLTSVGIAIGTPAFMAPEQAAGDPSTDHRADIYALGAVGYEMLTGQPVFSPRSPQAMLAAHAIESPEDLRARRPNVPEALAAIVMRCLEKQQADRPQTARDILTALDNVNTGTASGVTTAPTQTVSRPHRWPWIAAAALVVAAGMGALWLRPSATAPGQIRLVVLPFENLGESGDQYFADGVSEEVTNRLVKLAGLSVVARSSAAKWRKSGRDVGDIGKELGVDYVLDGTVRWAKSADGSSIVRVTPQLMKVSDGTQVWGEPYQGKLAQVFELQSEIAEKVAEALKGKLIPSDLRAVQRNSTTNVGAFNEYMLGRFEWKKRTSASLQKAAAHFEEALRLDPAFARAHAGLADTYGNFPFYGISVIPQRVAFAKARAAAERSIALDSTLAEGHTALAGVLYNADWDWVGAKQEFERAIQLDPDYGTARIWYAEVMLTLGQLDKALEAVRTGIRLEPLEVVPVQILALTLESAGRVDEAAATYRKAIAMDPRFPTAHWGIGLIEWRRGKPDVAIAEMVKWGLPQNIVAPIFNGVRGTAEKRLALATIRKGLSDKTIDSFTASVFYSVLGERELTLAQLNRAVDERHPWTPYVPPHPVYKWLRGDPAWEVILERIGVASARD